MSFDDGILGLYPSLQSFLKLFRPDIDSSTTFTLQSVDNGTNPQDPDEAGYVLRSSLCITHLQ